MKRLTRTLLGACVALGLAGCVERRFLIESDPPGAFVYKDGQFLGATPVDVSYLYYGKYEFMLVKDGFETLHANCTSTPVARDRTGVDVFCANLVSVGSLRKQAHQEEIGPV